MPLDLSFGVRSRGRERVRGLPLFAALWPHTRAVLVYAALACYVLANVLPRFNSAIPGAGVAQADGWQNTWNLWWVRRALSAAQNPYWTDLLFFPTGTGLYLHTLNITNALLTLPMQLVAGPVAAYNTAVFLGLVLTGFATYLLALRLINQPAIACVVGALFTFSPFHLSKVWDGHLSWISVQWVVFYLVALLAAFDHPPRRYAVFAGVMLAVATYTSWYYAVFSAIFTALLVMVRLPSALRDGSWRQHAVSLAIVGAVAALLTAPVVVPTMGEYLTGDVPAARYPPDAQMPGWDGETGVYSADLLDILYPSFLQPVWGDWSRDTHARMREVWFWTISPGFGVLIFALVGSVMFWRRVWQWVVLVGILFVLMLGPQLRVAGDHTGIPLPHELLRFVPGMTLAHRPNHFAIFMLPLLMVLAGFGMRALWDRSRWALAVLGTLVLLEYAVLPFPTLALTVHPQVAALAGQPGAILDLPPDDRTSAPMNNQMIHGRPIVGGYLARQPDVPPFVTTLPWLRQLWQLYPDDGYDHDIVTARPDDAQQAFRFYHITTILVRRNELKDFQDRDAARVVGAMLPGLAPTYSDAALRVYQIPPVAQPEPIVFLAKGWLPREHAGIRSWRWMSKEASLRLINPDTAARWVSLHFEIESYQEARSLSVKMGDTTLGIFTIQPVSQMLNLRLVVPPGDHTITFASPPTREQSEAHRWLSLSFSRIAVGR